MKVNLLAPMLKYMENDRAFILLCGTSFVMWILTVGNFTIFYFPPDAFYYAKSLPVTYWIGIALTITTILASLFSIRTKSDVKIIPQLILALYLHALPALGYEGYRYSDIYTHGNGVLRILSGDSLPSAGYNAEYPLSFMLMAQFIDTTGINPFVILKSYEILTVFLLTVLVYVIARQITPKYAPIASLALISLFWIDQGHFSPQAVALPFYLILWLGVMRILDDKKKSRADMILIVMALLAVNMSNPTNATFVFFNLVGILIVAMMKSFKSIFRMQFGRTIINKVSLVLLLHVVIWMAWSTYVAESRGISKAADIASTAMQAITLSVTDMQSTVLPPSPSYSYLVTNIVQYSTSIILWVVGLGIVILLHRKYKIRSDVTLVLTAGWFISVFFALPFTLYMHVTFVERVYMYSIFPFSILIILFIARSFNAGKKIVVPILLVIFIFTSALLIPISKYGQDPIYYYPSSAVYMSDSLTTVSKDGKVIILAPIKSLKSIYYFNAINDAKLRMYQQQGQVDATNYDFLSELSKRQYDYAISSGALNNNPMLRRSTDYLSVTESYANDDNLIINNGDSRAFMDRRR